MSKIEYIEKFFTFHFHMDILAFSIFYQCRYTVLLLYVATDSRQYFWQSAPRNGLFKSLIILSLFPFYSYSSWFFGIVATCFLPLVLHPPVFGVFSLHDNLNTDPRFTTWQFLGSLESETYVYVGLLKIWLVGYSWKVWKCIYCKFNRSEI